jgi:hypothetical protein
MAARCSADRREVPGGPTIKLPSAALRSANFRLQGIGWAVAGDDRRRVPGPDGACRGRRRLPRQATAGARHDLHHPAAGQRRAYDLARSRTGRRGWPALKGPRLGRPADLAGLAVWRKTTAHRYGRLETVYRADTQQVTAKGYDTMTGVGTPNGPLSSTGCAAPPTVPIESPSSPVPLQINRMCSAWCLTWGLYAQPRRSTWGRRRFPGLAGRCLALRRNHGSVRRIKIFIPNGP